MPITYDDFVLLLEQGAVDEEEIQNMITSSKEQFVSQHHKNAIFQIETGKLAGYWKTYCGIGKERRQLVKRNHDDLVDALYKYYREGQQKKTTYGDVFAEWLDDLCMKRNLSQQTRTDYLSQYSLLGKSFSGKDITTINETVIEDAIHSAICANSPTVDRLKRSFRTVHNTFEYAIRKHLVKDNPTVYVDVEAFYKDCKIIVKSDDEKEFSPEEVELIREDCFAELRKAKTISSPSPLMILLASYTGMRAGELPLLRWNDIVTDRYGDSYIHIHRQQSKAYGNAPVELLYTKDQRERPRDGRYFPITPQVDEVLKLADRLLPKCEEGYIFHIKGKPVHKDSYMQNLARRCKRLHISKGNNHCFRHAFNSDLIDLQLTSAERAVILGHSVRTNELTYSHAGTRAVRHIGEKLKAHDTYSRLLIPS